MEELKSDYHDANSYPLNDLDQTTSTTHLSQEKKQRTPLKPVVQHYLKALIKITPLETKATHQSSNIKTKKSLELYGTTKKIPDTKTIWHNRANMNITELGLKILEKTAEKAY